MLVRPPAVEACKLVVGACGLVVEACKLVVEKMLLRNAVVSAGLVVYYVVVLLLVD
jgi:hypothetical protein